MNTQRKQERIQTALALLERLAFAMVTCPDRLKMSVDVGTVIVSVTFTVHSNDVRTLVGREGTNIAEIASLLRMMLDGTGMEAVIEDIVGDGTERTERLPVATGGEWPKVKLAGLLEEIARACYPNERVAVEVRDGESRTRFNVLFAREPKHKAQFARATSLLFLPVGKAVGRRLVVDCKVVTLAVPQE